MPSIQRSEQRVALNIKIPKILNEDVRRVAKENGYTLTQLVTDALRTHILILKKTFEMRRKYPGQTVRLNISFEIDDDEQDVDPAALLYY